MFDVVAYLVFDLSTDSSSSSFSCSSIDTCDYVNYICAPSCALSLIYRLSINRFRRIRMYLK